MYSVDGLDVMEKFKKKYIMSSSITKDLEKPCNKDRIFDLNFCELPDMQPNSNQTGFQNATKVNDLG